MTEQNTDKTKQMYANIGKLITSSLKFKDILDGIMLEVKDFFKPQNWSLMRVDKNSDKLFFCITEGIDLDVVKKIKIQMGEGIAGTVAQTGRSIYVPDTTKDSRFSDRVDRISGFTTKSIIAVPMIFRGEVHGVIEIINREDGGSFTPDEHLILKTIADFSAIAFANAAIYEESVSISLTDSLTGLYNHAKLNFYIEKWSNPSSLKRRDKDRGTNIDVIFIDLDNFKEINDTFGHKEGDCVLIHTAERLKKILRSEDLLFRVGGDEFLAIIERKTNDIQDKARRRIEKDLSIINYTSMEQGYTVNFSYGISSGTTDNLSHLIHDADVNMYKNKNSKK